MPASNIPPPPPRRPLSSATSPSMRSDFNSDHQSPTGPSPAEAKDHLSMVGGWGTISSATDNTAVEVSFVDTDLNTTYNDNASDISANDKTPTEEQPSQKGSRRFFWIIVISIGVASLAVAIGLGVRVLQTKRTSVLSAAIDTNPEALEVSDADRVDAGKADIVGVERNENADSSGDDELAPIITGQPMSTTTASPATDEPTSLPMRTHTRAPTSAPLTGEPSTHPPTTTNPTPAPIDPATNSPTAAPVVEDVNNHCSNGGYCPGHLTQVQHGLRLSAGLDAKIIARTNKTVPLADGSRSKEPFHVRPDHAATFPFADDHPTNPGGWVYVSNAEADFASHGGVGSLFFDKYGNVIDYKMVLKGTTRNCGGGRTPWGTWVSCEENKSRDGQIYEVDPFGNTVARKTVLGSENGGEFESFAYDVRDRSHPRFFYTEDHKEGAVRRFTPSNPDWNTPRDMLHGEGVIEYLIFTEPNSGRRGKFGWTANETLGMESASLWFPNTEGIDQVDGQLFVVSKKMRRLFQLDLDTRRFISENVGRSGAFQGGPDQITRLIGRDREILYFTEDGGTNHPGVHGRDSDGNLFMILESQIYGYAPDGSGKEDESTGLAFSPDHMHMYVCYQRNGVVFDITRRDGKSFGGRSIDVKFHKLAE